MDDPEFGAMGPNTPSCNRCGGPVEIETGSCSSCGASVRSHAPGPSAPADPTTLELAAPAISGYRILGLLGKGGMGSVFLAHDEVLERQVAIKRVRPRHATDEDSLQRFLREARTMARVEHPNVVRIHAYGRAEDGSPFLVMELVDGESLAQRLRRVGALSVPETVRLLRQAVAGLQAAWERGVVHRDVKPGNLLIDADGELKVTDFGLAKALVGTGDAGLTASGLLLGTPRYMAPEQAMGQPADLRSDLYSLGLVAYEMLTGEAPFGAANPVAVIRDQVASPLPPLPDSVPEPLARLVQSLTAKDPATRPSSYGEVASRLEALGIVVGLSRPTRRMPQRRRALAAAAAAIGLLLLLVPVWKALEPTRAARTETHGAEAGVTPRAQATPSRHRQITFVGDALDPALSPDGEFLAYVSSETLYVQRVERGEPAAMLGDVSGAGDGGVRWLSSNALVLHRPFEVLSVSFPGGETRNIGFDERGGLFSPSPDGASLALYHHDQRVVRIADLRTGQQRPIPVEGAYDFMAGVDWSPDGRQLAVTTFRASTGEGALHVVSADGARGREVYRSPESLFSPLWAPRGNAVYVTRGQEPRGRTVVRISTSEVLEEPSVVEVVSGIEMGAVISIDRAATRLAYSQRRAASNLWSVPLDGSVPRPLTRGTRTYSGTVLSPDGETLAAVVSTGGAHELFTMSPTGENLRQRTFLDTNIHFAAWSPEGDRLAFTAGPGREGGFNVHLLDLVTESVRVYDHTRVSADSGQIAWAPAGEILYLLPEHRDFRRLDPETGAERPFLGEASPGWMFYPRFSPDGKRLALWLNVDQTSGTATEGEPKQAFHIIDLDSGQWRLAKEGMPGPSAWSADGSTLFVVCPSESESPGAVCGIEGDGSVRRVVDLPFHIPYSQLLAGEIVAAREELIFTLPEIRSDIWLVDDFDPEAR